MSKDLNDIPLEKLVAGAAMASEEEKYEILDAISKQMDPKTRDFFFELVELVKKGITPPENNQTK